jgi:two-component system chemotaxis sensor kinase CheA
MREQKLPISPGVISLVLEGVDEIKALLEGLEATGEEPKRDNATLISMLNELANGSSDDSGDAATQPAESTSDEASPSPSESDASNQTEGTS